MKKVGIVLCLVAVLFTLTPVTSQAAMKEGRGGISGFFIGCCLGLRTGIVWNEGKDLHWRDLIRFIPYISIPFAIWDGIECAQGITTPELVQRYGSNFY